MIQLVEGDILLSSAQVIAQGVSINDPMDKGLALALHERYPAMHKDFHHWCHQHHPKIGEAWLWHGAENVHIANLLIHEGLDNRDHRHGLATTSSVNHALRALAKLIQQEKFNSVALPRLATGAGGLAWSDVLPLIENQLGNLDVSVEVYAVYHAGQQAVAHQA
jgi:O-acetyl-ADP-ribose deacetylase (regulator of RNase III)